MVPPGTARNSSDPSDSANADSAAASDCHVLPRKVRKSFLLLLKKIFSGKNLSQIKKNFEGVRNYKNYYFEIFVLKLCNKQDMLRQASLSAFTPMKTPGKYAFVRDKHFKIKAFFSVFLL